MDAIDSIGKFLWRNRSRILLTGAVLGSAGLLFYYSSNEQVTLEEWSSVEEGANSEREEEQSVPEENLFVNRARQLTEVKKAQLVKIRRQFENARQKFLPTLRVKIFEVIDCSDAIQELRRLRSTSSASLQKNAEEALWEKIKIQSISILFVSVYMSCMVCTVLKLQFHLLGNYSNQYEVSRYLNRSGGSNHDFGGNLTQSMVSDVTLSPITTSRNIGSSNDNNSHINITSPFSSNLFLALIEQSYSHLLHEGMTALGQLCQDKTAAIFGSRPDAAESEHGGPGNSQQHKWYYKNTTSYEDLVGDLMVLRHSIECDLDNNLIQLALLPPDIDDSSALGNSSMLSGISAVSQSPDRVRLYSPASPEDSVSTDCREQEPDGHSVLCDVPLTPDACAHPYRHSVDTPESFVSASPCGAYTGSLGSYSITEGSNCTSSADMGVQLILNQLWDIVESPNYRVVLQEVLDKSFQRLFEELKQNKFVVARDNSANSIVTCSSVGNTTSATCMSACSNSDNDAVAELARPPLAILLPEFRKLVNNSLLPENPLVVSKIASEISSSPSLDALCILAYDSMTLPGDSNSSHY